MYIYIYIYSNNNINHNNNSSSSNNNITHVVGFVRLREVDVETGRAIVYDPNEAQGTCLDRGESLEHYLHSTCVMCSSKVVNDAAD